MTPSKFVIQRPNQLRLAVFRKRLAMTKHLTLFCFVFYIVWYMVWRPLSYDALYDKVYYRLTLLPPLPIVLSDVRQTVQQSWTKWIFLHSLLTPSFLSNFSTLQCLWHRRELWWPNYFPYIHLTPTASISISRCCLYLAVCSDYNHVRTWSITRFRGMISTQPGPLPRASFKLLSLEDVDPLNSYRAGIPTSIPWLVTGTVGWVNQ